MIVKLSQKLAYIFVFQPLKQQSEQNVQSTYTTIAEHQEALVLHNRLLRVSNATEHDLLPACVKYIQKLQGCPNSYPRKPMPYPNESIQHSIKSALASAGIDIR